MEKGNLTTGKVFNQIMTFSLPIFLGNLLQQLYNVADGIIVGQFVSKDAFAAVGLTGSISFLILGFVLGTCGGLCIPIAQFFGANDLKQMRKRVTCSIYISIVIAVVLTIITVLCSARILRLMNTPDNIFKDSYTYITIIFIGIPSAILYNLPANIARALGDSKTPVYFLLLSAVLNIILDFIFVLYFHMGVAGTALATVISQTVSGLLCIFYLKKRHPILKLVKEDWIIDWRHLWHSVYISVPMGLQFSITAIGTVILQSAVNGFGSDTVAAVNAASKIQAFTMQPVESLGMTMATFAGQNLGARRLDRIRSGVKITTIVACIYSVLIVLITTPLIPTMALIFMEQSDLNASIIQSMKDMLFYNGLFYIPLAIIFIYRNTIQGLGFSVLAMGAGLCELIARTFVVVFAIHSFGYLAICFAHPAAWIAADVMLLPAYFMVIRKMQRRFETTPVQNKLMN